MQDNTPTVEEEKASSSAKRPTSEIDEVFAGKKRKGPETEKAKKPVEDGIEKPSSSAKKRTSEIDEIFAGKKRKKPETEKSKKPKNPNGDGIENPNKLNKKKKDKGIRNGGFGDLPSKPKKRTQDGFAIYTEEELGINKADAGSTPLCPFDYHDCTKYLSPKFEREVLRFTSDVKIKSISIIGGVDGTSTSKMSA
ncbi:unnamed protein product [Prunus armeniaca]|uniref:Uncharacterized protein n=1 Tax=Prunus armeniaca TaxID=36596 RepID=A0A6J5W9U8_PRUAR|nr:unnamed protein product [Prunus armeniaca]CAB4296695.1 unnamed protein product [Prunus armeniaca]